MCHLFLGQPSFHAFVLACDRELAEEARQRGCSACGGRLHAAHYPRAGWGVPRDLPRAHRVRFSFCCADCRKRTTPSSLRFFGRRRYGGPLFLVICALQLGSPAAFRQLVAQHGIDRRTLTRWRHWWLEPLGRSRLWQLVRARLGGGIDRDRLPAGLLRGGSSLAVQILRALHLLRAATTGSPSLEHPAM